MTKSNLNNGEKTLQFTGFDPSEVAAIGIVRAVGYVLLILVAFDWVALLIPLNIMNPEWEFKTFGQLVERVPVPLIGFAMAFWGGLLNRRRGEVTFLKILSLLTLFLAVGFYLLVPLGVGNTVRLHRQNVTQIENILKQQIAQADAFEKKIDGANRAQIDQLLRAQGINSSNQGLDQIKEELRSRLSQEKTQIKNRSKGQLAARELDLFKRSLKWNVGAVLAGSLFIYLWRATRWIREA